MADFIKQHAGKLSQRFLEVVWHPPADRFGGAVLGGTAYFSGGVEESFEVLAVSFKDGEYAFWCDLPPHIPDRLVYYNEHPVIFKRGKVW